MRVGMDLMPVHDEDREAIAALPRNAILHTTVRVPVNGAFRRKWFALLRLVFDWHHELSAGVEYKGILVRPDFETFRKDVTILAGYYDTVLHLNGRVTLTARSIAWASMDDAEFSALYEATINVLTERILPRLFAGKRLDDAIEQVLDFG